MKELGEQVKKVEEYLRNLRIEGDAGGGLVKVIANGYKQIVNVEISAELFSWGDPQLLGQLVKAACNEALDRAQQHALEKIMKECIAGTNLAAVQKLAQVLGIL